MKAHYTIRDDGPYSSIERCNCDGEPAYSVQDDPRFEMDGELAQCYSTLAKAKARLIADHKNTIGVYRDAIAHVRTLKVADIE